jgi:hypothetical protein
MWEFCEQHDLLWSYTDKGLPKEVKRESGIPNATMMLSMFSVP